jgi:hypothetical protein
LTRARRRGAKRNLPPRERMLDALTRSAAFEEVYLPFVERVEAI